MTADEIRLAQGWIQVATGILGFVGVMATLAMNAWLSRRAHDRQITHERKVLRRALAEEIRRYLTKMTKLGDTCDGASPGQRLLIPGFGTSRIYDASIPKLGLLDAGELAAVIRGYDAVATFESKLGFFGSHEEKTPSLSYISVPPDRINRVGTLCRTHAPALVTALIALGESPRLGEYTEDLVEV